jgi:hypothetical protein
MKNYRLILLSFIAVITYLAITLSSCSLIFEEDISEEQMTIYTPSNNYLTNENSITFWWEFITDATSYNLQIVENKFDSAAVFVVDTNLTGNMFVYTLDNGKFEWRIRAYNSTSTTGYFYYSIIITQDQDISSDVIVISSPINYDTTNQTSIDFTWLSLPDADEYVFEVWDPNFNGTNLMSITIDTNSYNYSLNEGSFEWGVKGINQYYSTVFTKRLIYVDTTPPNTPTQTYPAKNSSIATANITFDWDRGTNAGSSISDSIYFYSDTTATNLVYAYKTNISSYSDSLGTGTFYWQVQSFDKAGNMSNESEVWKITLY